MIDFNVFLDALKAGFVGAAVAAIPALGGCDLSVLGL